MQNNNSFNPIATTREKRAWHRCNIKLLASIKEKIHNNHELTEPERRVLLKIRDLIDKKANISASEIGALLHHLGDEDFRGELG
ncbi:MAG: hypothetical protein Q8N91_04145 [Candidatus Omnitrophota bacterium]|nr:hypothetical protein [Candidatus Omnitrophota bacterium]